MRYNLVLLKVTIQGLFTLGGTVAEWLQCWTCNPEASSSTLALTASGWILSLVVPSSKIANWIAT